MTDSLDIEWKEGDQRTWGEFYSDFRDKDNLTEEITEEIAQAVHRAGNDVRIFTGREFDSLPTLQITDKLSNKGKTGGLPARYKGKSHRVDFSYEVPERDREHLRDGKIDEEGDFLYSLAVEEMTHALQAEQLGLNSTTGRWKQAIGKTVFPGFNDMPEFDAEGFSDWTAEHLGNFSFWDYREEQLRDVYNKPLEEIAAEAGMDLENRRHRKGIEKGREKMVERQIEAYTGHAFYRAFNEMNSLEETIDEAFTPTRPGEIDRVLETIEDSSVQPILYDELIKPYWNDEELDWKY